MKNIRNIGIFAHVDAGKTTLTEQMLKLSGAIRVVGSVDSGTAHTDRLDIERRRGISVRSACTSLEWRGVRINIIDTPGHADFSAEVEKGLWALDCAVLVISAAEGVEPQTEVLFTALSHLPMLVFINKTDRAAPLGALSAARETLSDKICPARTDAELMECLAEGDEQALEDYLSGVVYPSETLVPRIARLTREKRVIPALCGSALRSEGVKSLLDAIVDFLPPPTGSDSAEPSGVVFAVEEDRAMGRAAYVRLFSGELRNRGALEGRKISQIRGIAADGQGEDRGVLRAGEIGIVYGLGNIKSGEVLGNPALLPEKVSPGTLRQPLLLVKITPADGDRRKLRAALKQLTDEDPLISAEELNGDMHVRVMGAIQTEVIAEMLKTRFDIDGVFGPPNVIYRETISRRAEGFYAYTMPKPCWAVVKLCVEPLPRGSGVVFESVVPVRDIMERYQHQVRQAIPIAIRQGRLGWRVDDVKITLIDGQHHLIHTHPLDFIVATPVAFMDALVRGGSTLLEPILRVRLTIPDECAGKILGDIIAMRGETLESNPVKGMLSITAEVPVATSIDFPTRLASVTSGRGAMSAQLIGYRECAMTPDAVCPRKSVDPLDTAKYILAARSALDGGIFEF